MKCAFRGRVHPVGAVTLILLRRTSAKFVDGL